MAASGERERRAHIRFPTRLAVEVQFLPSGVVHQVRSRDISAGGMSIELTTPPPGDEDVTVVITLPSGEPLELKAWVRHVVHSNRTSTLGLQFEFGGSAQRAALETFLSTLS